MKSVCRKRGKVVGWERRINNSGGNLFFIYAVTFTFSWSTLGETGYIRNRKPNSR
jgi:hypothetical protein